MSYDPRARHTLAEVVPQTYIELAQGRTGRAIKRLEEVRYAYPYTLAAWEAKRLIESLQRADALARDAR